MSNDPREPDETLPRTDDGGGEPADRATPAPDGAVPQEPACPSHIGRYRVERLLGKGGFGLVYLAHDDQLQRQVAIKVPHRELTSQPADAEAYLDEARMLAHLDHPHIVPVHDVGSTPEFPCFFVSKYIDGTNLAHRMEQSALTYVEAAKLTATVAEALHCAHKQGLIHRDIKPGNILIDRNGKPYVVDFGLALKEAELGKGPRYAGTPAYMSPEQARGEGHRVDGRSDIYSLGAVLYQLLTGRRTFTANTRDELLQLIATQEPKPPRQIDDRIPKELERICLKALSRRASDRYTIAEDMADDLRQFLAGSEASQAVAANAPDTERHPGPDSGTPRADTPTPRSDSQPIKIVPKGLRSFDEHDADFFLELLPGPRDRNGLPDSIRFWKTRIEEMDADKTFSVGLIYGPSGCGKSSLVKAGLLPRLSRDVIVVYVEATGQETEFRLINGLRKRCPGLPQGLDLKQTLAALRLGQGLPVGKKVLIVLDQFEQWLHANWEEDHGELVHALRQCDGGQVQCLVMVRDDFWLAVSRLMHELEVRLVEGQNSALVDLFDLDHARRVLAAFGRAYGRLPEDPEDLERDQRDFLKQAVAGLAEEGKVICVRLSLFAEMMKGKSWVPHVLKQVGGAEGVGVTFLEETFSASTSPPEHRHHQKAARAVLKSLLPESGANIRGHMRSRDELLQAFGYARPPQDFDDLLNILDSGLRLITPIDPEGKEPDEDSAASAKIGQKHYQLTHDYLVPALQDWLNRKQKETRRGRAELCLAERAASWNAKPENRNLPSWSEYLRIRVLTDGTRWSESQRLMMRRADRVQGTRFVAAVSLLVIAAVAGFFGVSKYRESIAVGYVEQLLKTTAEGVAPFTELARPLKSHATPMLLARVEHSRRSPRERLHAACALAAFGRIDFAFPFDSVKDASSGECSNIVRALGNAPEAWLSRLDEEIKTADDKQDWPFKARLAIVALYLRKREPAEDMLESVGRPDPIQRTMFIQTFPTWYADLRLLKQRMEQTEHAGLRSGICLSIGSVAADEVSSEAKQAWEPVLSDWYQQEADTGTHSATGWAIRKWRLPLPAIASTPEPTKGRQWYVNSVGMTMLRIAEGSFSRRDEMVSNSQTQQVKITRPFFLSDREVSVGVFEQFMGDKEYPHEKPKWWRGADKRFSLSMDHPVESVNWMDAAMFCNWLSRKEGLTPCYAAKRETSPRSAKPSGIWEVIHGATGYRLPAEGEWEYACRAGVATVYSFGDDASSVGWYAVFKADRAEPCGSKLPNAWGLFDMHGNVWEWCEDWYGPNATAIAVVDPMGPAVSAHKVARGGGWRDPTPIGRASIRFGYSPGTGLVNLGFRLARTVSLSESSR